MSETKAQRKKIIDLCRDGQWHCQNEFRDLYIFSPHKRRIEIEGRKNRNELPTGMYIFEERKCEHGVRGQKDYRMFLNERLYKRVEFYVPDINKTITKYEKIGIERVDA